MGLQDQACFLRFRRFTLGTTKGNLASLFYEIG